MADDGHSEGASQRDLRQLVDDLVEQFEESWQQGEQPSIDALLPEERCARLAVLTELVHCDLELHIRQGDATGAEEYLQRYPELQNQRETVIELVETEFVSRRRQHPGLAVEAYLDRFPELGHGLAERLLRAAERCGQNVAGLGQPPHAAEGATASPRATESTQRSETSTDACLSDRCEPAERDAARETLDRFILFEVLGQGTFATVYRAYDPELDRVVALKTPHNGRQISTEESQRFLREARSAAQLSHPGIVQVYEVVQGETQWYIVSEYVAGQTLAQAIEVQPFGIRDAVRIVLRIAEALHHAHDHGVVHRDLKPSNIILAEHEATPYPRLMDFGLARRDQGEATVTMEGQILGTPAYMSPEQADGRAHQVDRRSDIYSLGAILYRLLTGEVPFGGTVRMVLLQVLYEEPRPPRQLNDQIPRDLETICLKCMEKSADARYPTAEALAGDLEQFLRGGPIQARPLGRPARCWRWCKRNPRVAALSGLSSLLLALVISITVIAGLLNRQAYQRERIARRDVERNLYYSCLHQATLEYQTNRMAGMRKSLDQAARAADRGQPRGWEWYYLDSLTHTFDHAFQAGTSGAEWVTCLAFSPNSQLLAAGSGVPPYLNRVRSAPASLKVWDLPSSRLVLDLEGQVLSIACLAFSPDGAQLAVAEQDWCFRPGQPSFHGPGRLRLWNVATGREDTRLPQTAGIFNHVAYSPNGHFVIASGREGSRIWDVTAGEVTCELAGQALWSFPSDDGCADFVDDQRALTEVNLRTGELVRQLGQVTPGRRSPDGRLTAAPGQHAIHVWDVSTGDLRSIVPHDGELGFAFRPDCRQLAHGTSDGIVQAWDFAHENNQRTLRAHNTHVQSVAFSPNSRWLASGDWNGQVFVWNAARHPEHEVLGESDQRNHPVEALAFRAGDRQVVTLRQRLKQLTIWDVAEAAAVQERILPIAFERKSPCRRAAMCPNGSLLAGVAAADERIIKIWDVVSGRECLVFSQHTQPVQFLTFGYDQRLVASAAWSWEPDEGPSGTSAEIMVWDAQNGNVLFRRTEVGRRTFRLALHPNGRMLAATSVSCVAEPDGGGEQSRPELRIWELPGGRCLLSNAEHHSNILGLAFCPQGRQLASASFDDGAVKFWDLETLQLETECEQGSRGIEDLAYSPDGCRLAGVTRRTVALWDADTGHRVLTLEGHVPSDNPVFNPQVVFSSDGESIAATQFDDTVCVWTIHSRHPPVSESASRGDAASRATVTAGL